MTPKYLWIPMLSVIILLAACSQAVSTATSLAGTSTVVSTSTATSPPPTNTPTPTSPAPTVTPTEMIAPSPTSIAEQATVDTTYIAHQWRPNLEQLPFTLTVDNPWQIAQPGETITYTLHITNNGPAAEEYVMGAYGGGFPITGGIWTYRTHPNEYRAFFDIEPYKQHSLDITVKIPLYATHGMVNLIEPHISNRTSFVELQLTTVVSSPTNIEYVAHIGGVSPQDIFVQKPYAYLAAGRDGLRILDISEPNMPTEVGFYTSEDNPFWHAKGVVVKGDYAYLAAGQAGLNIIDISDPTTPIEVGFYNTLGSATDVTVTDDYAYVTWRICNYPPCSSQLYIIDVSNPTTPIEVGSHLTSNQIYDVEIVGERAYLSVHRGLEILDITHPSKGIRAMFLEQPYSHSYHPYNMVIEGEYAYLAVGDKGLHILDMSNPISPTEITVFKESGMYLNQEMALVDNYIYLTDQSYLYIIDVSNPTTPISISTTLISKGYGHTPIVVIDDYAYLAGGLAGLRIFDISNPTSPSEVNIFSAPIFAQGISIVNGYAYVADGYHGLRIFDISTPLTPIEVGFYNKQGGAQTVTVKDTYAYVNLGRCESTYNRSPPANCDINLYVLDVSNPAAPLEVDGYEWWKEVKISGDFAYVLDEERALHVFDISDPTTPTKVNFLDEEVTDFELANGYLYLLPPNNFKWVEGLGTFTSDSYLKILEPISLVEVGSYHLPEEYPADGVIVSGRYVYVHWSVYWTTRHDGGWLTVDISDPTTPVASDIAYNLTRASYDAVDGHYAYIAADGAGLRILDISDPANPIEVDAFGADNMAMDVAVSNGYIYLANGSGGLHILRYPK